MLKLHHFSRRKSVPQDQKYVDTPILHPYVIVEHLFPKPWALICCYNGLHSSGKTFKQILELACRDLLPFRHKSISVVGHWPTARQTLLPEGVGKGLRSGFFCFFAEASSSTPNFFFFLEGWGAFSLWSWLCSQRHCHVDTRRGLPKMFELDFH